MSDDHGPRPAIYVDEHHFYDVLLGAQSQITWTNSWISLRMHVPYDGRLPYKNRGLRDLQVQKSELRLGTLKIKIPNAPNVQEIPITLPAGADWPINMQSGLQSTFRSVYPLPQPQDTLIAVHGEVFDGADTTDDDLQKLVREQIEAFGSDLRLRIELWIPDLLARAQREKDREIDNWLLHKDTSSQICLAGLGDLDLLAQSLVALANARGGRLLLGVDQQGNVVGLPGEDDTRDEQVKLALLKAALRCAPAVGFSSPSYFKRGDRWIAYLNVPESRRKPHQIGDKVYRREGAITLAEPAAPQPVHRDPAAPPRYVADSLARGGADDVVVLDAGRTPIEKLPIGRSICGLINAGVREGLILIRNAVPPPSGWLGRFTFWRLRRTHRRIKTQLQDQLKHVAPRFESPEPHFIYVDDEPIVAIGIAAGNAAAALFRDEDAEEVESDEWVGRTLLPLSVKELFARYLQHVGVLEAKRIEGDKVQMLYGELAWPIRPPAEQSKGYEIQRQAMAWRTRPFVRRTGVEELVCVLTMPLRHALVDETGVDLTPVSNREGHLIARIQGLLASGTEVTQENSAGAQADLPIYKRTFLRLNLKVEAQELFKRRRHMSLLRFQLPNVILNNDRVTDLKQACADLGFRIMDVANEMESESLAMFEGMRSRHFCDISLLTVVIAERTVMARDLVFDQRIDSKDTPTDMLDIRIVLWGYGDQALQEISLLQIPLYELIHQRMQYLHSV